LELFIITGTSRGIGLAFAERVLRQNDTVVFGIARTNSIINPNFNFLRTDLVSEQQVNEIHLPIDNGFTKIILVNNAGMLGDVHHLGEMENQSIAKTIAVNLTAPTLLLNRFLHFYASSKAQKIVINISSGAGRRAIPSWSVYCATKAALDMVSETAQQEQIEKGTNTRIFSVAPGVVDTAMQEEIRSVEQANFSQVNRFQELKKKGELASKEKVAENLLQLATHPEKFSEVILDIRTF